MKKKYHFYLQQMRQSSYNWWICFSVLYTYWKKFILMVEERLWEKFGSWVCNIWHYHIFIRHRWEALNRQWLWEIHKMIFLLNHSYRRLLTDSQLNNHLCWSHKTVNNNILMLCDECKSRRWSTDSVNLSLCHCSQSSKNPCAAPTINPVRCRRRHSAG